MGKGENTCSHSYTTHTQIEISLKDHFIVHVLSANLIQINHHLICYYFTLCSHLCSTEPNLVKCETDSWPSQSQRNVRSRIYVKRLQYKAAHYRILNTHFNFKKIKTNLNALNWDFTVSILPSFPKPKRSRIEKKSMYLWKSLWMKFGVCI